MGGFPPPTIPYTHTVQKLMYTPNAWNRWEGDCRPIYKKENCDDLGKESLYPNFIQLGANFAQ